MFVCSVASVVSLLFVTPRTVAHQAPLSMGFPRQEYWSGLPFHSPGDLPNPRIKPTSLVSPALAGRFFTPMPPGSPLFFLSPFKKRFRNQLSLKASSLTKCLIDLSIQNSIPFLFPQTAIQFKINTDQPESDN